MNEILKVTKRDNGNIVVQIVPTYDDPGAWGIILVDLVKHLGNAYEQAGGDKDEVQEQILEVFTSELENPTDDPRRIK